MLNFFFKSTPKLTSYDKPVLFAHSDLPGFVELLACGPGRFYPATAPLPWIRIVSETEIPIAHPYFKYIGSGKFKRVTKHDPNPKGKFEASVSEDVRNAVNDFSMNLGNFSPTYSKDDLFSLCFDIRSQRLY